MNRLLLFLFGFLSLTLGAVIGAPQNANATPAIETTSNLTLYSPNGLNETIVDETLEDFDARWYSIAYEAPGSCAYKSDFQSNIADGGYRVVANLISGSPAASSYVGLSGDEQAVLFSWNNTVDPGLAFSNLGDSNGAGLSLDNPSASAPGTYVGILRVLDDGSFRFDCNVRSSPLTSIHNLLYFARADFGSGLETVSKLYYSAYEIVNNYTDLPDPTFPSVPPSAVVNVDYRINFSYSNTTTSLIARYLNKVTDPVASLNDPKYIWWTLFLDAPNITTGTVVCDDTSSINVPFNTDTDCNNEVYNLDIDTTKTYYLVARISTIDNPDIEKDGFNITFKQTVFRIDFSEPSMGTTEMCNPATISSSQGLNCDSPETIDFTQCFTNSFPYVDPFECLDNFVLIFNLVVFGNVAFPSWSHQPNCTTLNTMDDWLNLPDNYQVCPMISNEVRFVVTPFIVFMLGIVTLGFINRHNRDVGGRGI